MPLNFPSAPINGETYSANGVLYTYNSTKTLWTGSTGGTITIVNADTLDGIDSTSFLRSDADDTASGTLTLSGNVNIDGYLTLSVSNNISAAGTTQGTATALTSTINRVTTITAASAEGVILPSPVVGQMVIVYNDDATDTLKIYPHSGALIDGYSTDVAISLGPQGTLKFYAITVGFWVAETAVYA